VVSPWSREYADPGDEPGATVDGSRPGAPPVDPPSPWRSPATLAIVAVVAAVVAVAVLGVVTIGDSDETSATTPATSPPVLLTLPLAERADEALRLRLPVFEPVLDESGELDDYDLMAAIEDAAARPAAQARFVIRGLEPPVRTVIATRDRTTDLDELIVQSAGVTTSSLVHAGTATTYTTSSTGNWVGRWLAYDETELPADGTGDTRSVVDAIVGGPITSRMLGAGSAVADDGLVRLDDGTTARRYRVDVTFDAGGPPAWLRFAAVDSSMIDAEALPASLSFDVYVTKRPSLALVASRVEIDGAPFLFVQYFDQVPDAPHLQLPPDWAVIEVT
jgi:hypothetical protein